MEKSAEQIASATGDLPSTYDERLTAGCESRSEREPPSSGRVPDSASPSHPASRGWLVALAFEGFLRLTVRPGALAFGGLPGLVRFHR